ncbi:MAG: septum formation inhibitor Maf [Halioglobus sp.]|nr:septum formation inhibitor Maf [Halioglobus sp.]
MELVLASNSPRRRELLTQLGVAFRVVPADIDESVKKDETPQDYVLRMAMEKAQAVAQLEAGTCVLGADTTVVLDEDILGKPAGHGDALATLARLSGRSHEVMTGICLTTPGGSHGEVVTTQVTFVTLDLPTCEAYLATDEPWDKAGGYGIQGLAGAFVRGIEGSYSNVVGLPLAETWELLRRHGVTGLLSEADVGSL